MVQKMVAIGLTTTQLLNICIYDGDLHGKCPHHYPPTQNGFFQPSNSMNSNCQSNGSGFHRRVFSNGDMYAPYHRRNFDCSGSFHVRAPYFVDVSTHIQHGLTFRFVRHNSTFEIGESSRNPAPTQVVRDFPITEQEQHAHISQRQHSVQQGWVEGRPQLYVNIVFTTILSP